MKKLTIVSDESILGGNPKTGIADVTDGLANALNKIYCVNVVVPDYNGYFVRESNNVENFMEHVRYVKLLGTHYYLIQPEYWDEKLDIVVNSLSTDILHNFSRPELINSIDNSIKTIYTIDHAKFVMNKLDELEKYDVITTVSENYAKELLELNNSLSKLLKRKNFIGITNGILSQIYDPSTGFMISNKFTSSNITGKKKCKNDIIKNPVDINKTVYLMICRLSEEKGINEVLNSIDVIKELDGILIIYGKGNEEYENILQQESNSNNVIWINEKPSFIKAIKYLAGADFYLSPSLEEPCGLMPMAASRYGTIPIVSQVGGLKDNFNNKNAIIIQDNLQNSIKEASELINNPLLTMMKQKHCMNTDFSWETRKNKYLEIYKIEK